MSHRGEEGGAARFLPVALHLAKAKHLLTGTAFYRPIHTGALTGVFRPSAAKYRCAEDTRVFLFVPPPLSVVIVMDTYSDFRFN